MLGRWHSASLYQRLRVTTNHDPASKQITNPVGQYEINEKSVSNGDHSFDAKYDGKYTYCFGNQHWGANSKEVSFNVHGVVYVSETEYQSDPLDAEGT